jgi:gliding motility-associated-like protein
VICIGGSDGTAAAAATGGTPPYTFQWNTGAQGANVTGLGAGLYAVTASDANGCTATATVTVLEPAAISLQITGDAGICEYDSVRLSPQISGGVAPYSYQWWSVPTAVNDSLEDLVYLAGEDRTYYVEITDANGCQSTASYFVEAYDRPFVDFYPDRGEFCDTGTVHFINMSFPANVSSYWEFSDGTTSQHTAPDHLFGSGIWGATLTVTTNEGCVNSITHEQIIHIIPTPQASFETDPNITLVDHLMLSEATITFNNTSPWFATAVDWSFGNGDSAFVGQVTYTYQDTGRFCIKMNAYNDFGCHTDTTQCITILQDPFLWVPTGFTPNGDGLNDIYLVGGLEIVAFDISIFDRWGKLIFFSDSMTEGWDGRFSGEGVNEGVYVFKINATNNEGFKIAREGTLTLVR